MFGKIANRKTFVSKNSKMWKENASVGKKSSYATSTTPSNKRKRKSLDPPFACTDSIANGCSPKKYKHRSPHSITEFTPTANERSEDGLIDPAVDMSADDIDSSPVEQVERMIARSTSCTDMTEQEASSSDNSSISSGEESHQVAMRMDVKSIMPSMMMPRAGDVVAVSIEGVSEEPAENQGARAVTPAESETVASDEVTLGSLQIVRTDVAHKMNTTIPNDLVITNTRITGSGSTMCTPESSAFVVDNVLPISALADAAAAEVPTERKHCTEIVKETESERKEVSPRDFAVENAVETVSTEELMNVIDVTKIFPSLHSFGEYLHETVVEPTTEWIEKTFCNETTVLLLQFALALAIMVTAFSGTLHALKILSATLEDTKFFAVLLAQAAESLSAMKCTLRSQLEAAFASPSPTVSSVSTNISETVSAVASSTAESHISRAEVVASVEKSGRLLIKLTHPAETTTAAAVGAGSVPLIFSSVRRAIVRVWRGSGLALRGMWSNLRQSKGVVPVAKQALAFESSK